MHVCSGQGGPESSQLSSASGLLHPGEGGPMSSAALGERGSGEEGKVSALTDALAISQKLACGLSVT